MCSNGNFYKKTLKVKSKVDLDSNTGVPDLYHLQGDVHCQEKQTTPQILGGVSEINKGLRNTTADTHLLLT